jgi:carbon starvation protein
VGGGGRRGGGGGLGIKKENRYLTSALAVAVIAFFAFYKVDGRPVGLSLWSLFGTTNQLLASLTLLLATLYLYQRGRNFWLTAVPMVLMTVTTIVAMATNLASFGRQGQTMLFVVGLVLLLLAAGVIVEALGAFRRSRRERRDGKNIAWVPEIP